jgi:hypothetical protein
LRRSQQNKSGKYCSIILFVLCIFLAANCEAQSKCSCHELVWKDHDLQIFRLVIQPHSSSLPFWHGDDYTFVPLTPRQTLESVREGETPSPFRKAKAGSISWTLRDSMIRIVHPRQTEPEGGQVIFNPEDQPYVAIEILSNKPVPLPTLKTRLSMFGPKQGEDQLVLGSYAISIQPVAPSDEIRWQSGTPLLLLSANPLNLEYGPRQISLGVGDLFSLGKDIASARNSTTLSTRVMVLYKASQPVLMAAK